MHDSATITLAVPDRAILAAALSAGLVPDPERPIAYALGDGLLIGVSPDLAPVLEAAGCPRAADPTRWSTAPCWWALLPPTRAPIAEPPLGEVLFVARADGGFLSFAAELIRLGCDAVALCAFAEDGADWVACRVTAPPYFAYLRGVEPGDGLRAFHPTRRGLWIEAGAAHVAGDRLDRGDHWVLIGKDGRWQTIPDGPWIDVHAWLDIRAPEPVGVRATSLPARLTVPLRLVSAPAPDPVTLWVISEDAPAVLERLVRALPETVLEQLAFQATGAAESPVVILRARQGRPPPALTIEGLACCALPGVGNLFLPRGTTIDPPLRRARLRALLTPDPARISWVEPRDDGGLRVWHVADDGFAPLSDWVDYLVAAHQPAVAPWIRSARFAFDRFVSVGREWSEGPAAPKVVRPSTGAALPIPRRSAAPRRAVARPHPPIAAPDPLVLPDVASEPSEAERVAAEAEAAFCADATPWDAVARSGGWARLAVHQAAVDRPRDAAACWARAVWLAPPGERAALAGVWLERMDPASHWAPVAGLVADETADLVAARAHLDAHASALDLRSFWLGWQAIAARTDDRLALVRARDHVFARLRGGLPLAGNVPAFVRMHGSEAGANSAERLSTALADMLARFLETPRAHSALEADPRLTAGYVRLCFVWGFARLGATDQVETHRALALADIQPRDPIHDLCVATFEARIEQALAGQPPGAPLPADLHRRREALDRFSRYKVDRLRQQSRILDPSRHLDAFVAYQKDAAHPHGEDIAALLRLTDPDSVAAGVRAHLARETGRAGLLGALDVLGTVPVPLAIPLVHDIVDAAQALAPADAVAVLEEAAVLAAALDRPALIGEVLAGLAGPAAAVAATAPEGLVDALARLAPTLAGAGHRDALRGLLSDLDGTLEGRSPPVVRARLQVMAARAAVGESVDLTAAFNAACGLLPRVQRDAERLEFIREMAMALGQTSAARAVAGVQTLMTSLPTVTDIFGTNSHFCLSVIQFMESMVLALASEALSLDAWARRWVEIDEHLLRRRIHQDLA